MMLTTAAVIVTAVVVTLLVGVVPLTTNGVGTEDIIPEVRVGSAVIHDDVGNVHR